MSDDSQNDRANTPENTRGLPPAFAANMWKPGQSGNPSGRPKKSLLSQRLEELCNDPEAVEEIIQQTRRTLTSRGMAGVLLQERTLDRVDGKPVQPVDLSGEVNLSISRRLEKARQRAESTENENL